MKNYVLILFILANVFAAGCAARNVYNFEGCIAAGNQVIESYPRQCRYGDKVFTEKISGLEPGITFEEALEIAQDSECAEKGNLTKIYMYNGLTKTWWINLNMEEEFKRDNCNPACVIDEAIKTAEINWRCSGAEP